jgi:hypothetical protein
MLQLAHPAANQGLLLSCHSHIHFRVLPLTAQFVVHTRTYTRTLTTPARQSFPQFGAKRGGLVLPVSGVC